MALAEILHLLAAETGVPAPRMHAPFALAMAVAWFSEWQGRLTGKPVLVSREGLRSLRYHAVASSALAERELGVRFRPFPETLRHTLAWYRSRTGRTDRQLLAVSKDTPTVVQPA